MASLPIFAAANAAMLTAQNLIQPAAREEQMQSVQYAVNLKAK